MSAFSLSSPRKNAATVPTPSGLVFPAADHAVLKSHLLRYWELTLKEIILSARKAEMGSPANVLKALSAIGDAYAADRDFFFSCLKSSGIAPIIHAFHALEQWPKHRHNIIRAAPKILPLLLGEIRAKHPPLSEQYRWPVLANTWLTLDDLNPLATEEAHPEKSGNKPDLGGRSAEEWVKSLQSSLELIRLAWPELFQEFSLLIDRIIPVGYDAQKHFSASYREAIGTIYLSLHPDPLVMATALIHEFQHNKINLVSYFDPLLKNAFHPLYKSPVRPDPRPLWGIFLAAHAFVPIEIFYYRLQRSGMFSDPKNDFRALIDETRRKNAEGLAVLARNARWTPLGRALMDELTQSIS